MRRRSTFIPDEGSDYDPSEIRADTKRVSFAGLKAAREERLTFGLNELPTEIVSSLQQLHEAHVRWVSESPYEKSGPYVSSLNPGIHIHYTPLGTNEKPSICPLLRKVFSPDLRCQDSETAFSRPDILSERFAFSATSQYYSVLPSLQHLVQWLQRNVCLSSNVVCTHTAALLNLATYVDFDYDSISHALTLTVFWSKAPSVLMDPISETITNDQWDMAFHFSPKDKTEVGILNVVPASEPSNVQMEGILLVVGDDEVPKPTMFFFPSRHHTLPQQQSQTQQYRVTVDGPTGLHPTLRIRFPSQTGLQEPHTKPHDSTCGLHAYLTLPSVLFADQYAFPKADFDPLFTEAHNIISLRSISGELDLEAPDYVVQKWGSALLLELATPNSSVSKSSKGATQAWDITIPLHLRYLKPTTGGQRHIEIPWPVVFWACTTDEGTKFTVNPFDRVNLGYDGLFGPRTMFYHLEPAKSLQERLVESIDVPVLNTDVMNFGNIELLTMALVLSGFLVVAWSVLQQITRELQLWSRQTDQTMMKKKQ